MARTRCFGWEGRDLLTSGIVTGPEGLYTNGTGAAVETTIVRKAGTKGSGKVALTSGVSGYWSFGGDGLPDYFRVYVRVTARPATTARVLLGNISAGSVTIRLNPSGTLAYYVNTTLIGTSTTALTDTAKWYRIEWRTENGTSVTVLQIDGVAEVTGSPSSWSWFPAFGTLDTVADTYTVYFDDYAGDDAGFPGAGGAALLVPTADSARDAKWTAGAGGTTNLWEAVNNLPPVGVASASETDLTNIEHSGNSSNTTDRYDATMETYTAAGVPTGATVNVVTAVTITGEDIATGAKLLSHQILSNPVGTSSGSYDANGGTSAAHGTYPTNWFRTVVSDTAPSVTLGTAPVMRIIRPETASRVACCCFMGIMVDYSAADTVTTSRPLFPPALRRLPPRRRFY